MTTHKITFIDTPLHDGQMKHVKCERCGAEFEAMPWERVANTRLVKLGKVDPDCDIEVITRCMNE